MYDVPFIRMFFCQFHLAIQDIPEVLSEAKKTFTCTSLAVGQHICIEISLKTAEGENMILENWSLTKDERYINMNQHRYRTRARELSCVIPRVKSSGLTSFLYQGVCHWNNLPLEIMQCPSKDNFKYQVKCLYSRLFVQETSLYRGRN